MNTDKNFREYYSSGRYRGFRKYRQTEQRISGRIWLTFTNNSKKITVYGKCVEDALEKAFRAIDCHYRNSNRQSAAEMQLASQS